jgi:hypothetical protein
MEFTRDKSPEGSALFFIVWPILCPLGLERVMLLPHLTSGLPNPLKGLFSWLSVAEMIYSWGGTDLHQLLYEDTNMGFLCTETTTPKSGDSRRLCDFELTRLTSPALEDRFIS